MNQRQEAKMGLQKMDAMGQMGNGDEATMPDDMPFDMADLVVVGGQGEPMMFADGGFVPAQNFEHGGVPHTTETLDTAYVPTFTAEEVPDYESYMNSVVVTSKEYKNAEGESIVITFIDGKPSIPIPDGYTLVAAGTGTSTSTGTVTPAAAVVNTVNTNNDKRFKDNDDPYTEPEVQTIDYNSMTSSEFAARMEYESSKTYQLGQGVGFAIASLVPFGTTLAYASMRGHARKMEMTINNQIQNATSSAEKTRLTKIRDGYLKANKLKPAAESNALAQFADGYLVRTGFTIDQGKAGGTAVAEAASTSTLGGQPVGPLESSLRPRLRPETPVAAAVAPTTADAQPAGTITEGYNIKPATATQTNAALGANINMTDTIARGPQRFSSFTDEPNVRTAGIVGDTFNAINRYGTDFGGIDPSQSEDPLFNQVREKVTTVTPSFSQTPKRSEEPFVPPPANITFPGSDSDNRDTMIAGSGVDAMALANVPPAGLEDPRENINPDPMNTGTYSNDGKSLVPSQISDSQLSLGQARNAEPRDMYGRSPVDQTSSAFNLSPSNLASQYGNYGRGKIGQTGTPFSIDPYNSPTSTPTATDTNLTDEKRRQQSQKNITGKAKRTSKGTGTRKAARTGDDRLSQANFLERALGIEPAKVGARRGNDGVLYRTQADKREADKRQEDAKVRERNSARAVARRDGKLDAFNKKYAKDIEKRHGGEKEDTKIVCTEMYRQTQLVDWQHTMKIWHVYQEKHLTPYHQVGYHWLFKPYVRGMKNSSILTKLGAALAKHRTEHLRYILTKGKAKDNLIGNVWCKFVHPLVYIAGIIKEKIGK